MILSFANSAQTVDLTGFSDRYYVKWTPTNSCLINKKFHFNKPLAWLIGSLLAWIFFPLPHLTAQTISRDTQPRPCDASKGDTGTRNTHDVFLLPELITRTLGREFLQVLSDCAVSRSGTADSPTSANHARPHTSATSLGDTERLGRNSHIEIPQQRRVRVQSGPTGKTANEGHASLTTCVNRDSSRPAAKCGTSVKSVQVILERETQDADKTDDWGKLQHSDQADKARRRSFGVNSGSHDAPPAGVAAPAENSTTLGNPSPGESPTDKAFDPKYSAIPPSVSVADRLALEWLLLDPRPNKGTDLSERILAYLILQEAHATRPFRVDYRVAQVIVMAAERGESDPIGYAWQSVLHCRPEQVWPNIVNNRKLRLGAEYHDWYDSNDNLRPDIPRFKVPADDQVLARRTAALEPEAGETTSALGPTAVSPVLPEKKPPQPSTDGKRGIA